MKKILFFYFLFFFFLLSFFSSGVIDSQDGFQYLAVARNIYYKGEPTAPVYEYDKEKNIHMSTYVGSDGKTYSPTGLGYSLAMVPAVAITDIVYKIYGTSPPVHFPLENDWLILLTAAFINVFFVALLGVVMFYYFILLNLTKKQAFLLTLVTLFATNLFVLSKHSFAHMMFITFLMLSFLMLKLNSIKKTGIYLIFTGLSYGVVMITYNLTFILTLPALIVYYYLIQQNPAPVLGSQNKFRITIIKILQDGARFLLGALPFILIFLWFENLRQHADIADSSIGSQTGYGLYQLINVPAGVFLEGIYGQLLSPGRSIFLYSPILLILILFWFKIKKKIFPELWAFIFLAAIYIPFYATQFSVGLSFKDQGYAALWHGESSWGPRYLSAIIPVGMLIIGFIYQTLSKKPKLFVFLPLAMFGLFVELLGVLMPYQIKFHDLDHRFYVNQTEYTAFSYSNLLPRYSPVFMMSKKLIKLVKSFPKTLDNGGYNVRFYDGIDFPFNVGPERWRTIEGQGYISFDNKNNNPVRLLSFGLINHPISDSNSIAKLQFNLNGNPLTSEAAILNLRERKVIDLPVDGKYLKEKNNELSIFLNFDKEDIIKNNMQILGLISFAINGNDVNKESIDVPYVSSLGPKMTGALYKNWGGTNLDPWRFWEIHTQVYERTPDFWWIKPFYYWDLPKKYFFGLFVISLIGIAYFGYRTLKFGKNV